MIASASDAEKTAITDRANGIIKRAEAIAAQ
jgi:hypothetical protein